MRISFLLVLALALLVGLGVVFAIKTLGLLSPATPPPPPPTSAPPVRAPLVLVPQRPLFPGDAILPGDLGAREMNEAEFEDFKKNKDNYLPPNSASAHYRFVKEAHAANEPLLKSHLEPIRKPTPLNQRLLPGTRAVNLTVTKNQSAGSLIQHGDWVDVYLTTNVGVQKTDGVLLRTPELRTALIARNVHVIAKRDSLYDLYYPQRSNEISYTLAMNPYRAALFDYARGLGTITLEPVSQAERVKLDKEASDPATAVYATVGDTKTEQGMAEAERIKNFEASGQSIGPADLAAAMQLPVLPPITITRAKPPVEIETMFGTGKPSMYVFQPSGTTEIKLPPPEYFFSNPAEPVKVTTTQTTPAKTITKLSPGGSPLPR